MSCKEHYDLIIAEDEYRIRENLVKKIEDICPRFRVTDSVSNGEEALELVRRRIPDLLLTDIKMPVMDGMELIEELYMSFPELPVVIISGYDDFRYAKKAIQFGVKDYILKPVSKKELHTVLQKLEAFLDRTAELPMFDRYEEGTAAEELSTRLTEFLKAGYTKDISISDLAERFRLNPTYMSRVFKQQTGRTPTRFLTELRVNRARKLLHDRPDLEIKEIALSLGFSDQGYFSRLFKKETGLSPLDYRNS